MAREFAFAWDAVNCAYTGLRPIDDVVNRIELALKQENPANVISRQHMHIFAPETCFPRGQRAALLDQGFVLHDTPLRNERCDYMDDNGIQCDRRFRTYTGVEEVPFDRWNDIAVSEMIDFLLMVPDDFPKFILIASTDSDFFETTKSLADRGHTVFMAKNETDDGRIWAVNPHQGVSVTYHWRRMPSGYGRLYKSAVRGTWNVQGRNEVVQEAVHW